MEEVLGFRVNSNRRSHACCGGPSIQIFLRLKPNLSLRQRWWRTRGQSQKPCKLLRHWLVLVPLFAVLIAFCIATLTGDAGAHGGRKPLELLGQLPADFH